MSSLLSYLLVYLLGGITLLPLLLGSIFLYAYYTFPVVGLEEPIPPLQREEDDDGVFKTGDKKLLKRLNNTADVAAGYFIVTREYVPGGTNGKPPERASPVGISSGNDSSSMFQSVQSMSWKLLNRRTSTSASDPAGGGRKIGTRARNEFFVAFRHGHLMLYDDMDQAEVRHVIPLGFYRVSIYDGVGEVPEGELYIRRNAIRLSRSGSAIDRALNYNPAGSSFFLFSENCSAKEDFYLALVKNQERRHHDPTVPPTPLRYEQKHIISLLQQLHSSEEHLQTNWLNGLFGRLFLAVYKTPEVEAFIRAKITKKISRTNKPNFLSDIEITKIDVGEGVPYITNPRLKELTADGSFCAEADVSYSGNFRLEITTKATINIASRFNKEFTIVLAVVFKKLEGHALIRIKPPPSNRLWISFETPPKMELSIEPIVAARQINWNILLRSIESKIREAIVETMVLPHYDDLPFMDTFSQKFRGGIWEAINVKLPTGSESSDDNDAGADVEKDSAVDANAGTPLVNLNEKSMSTPTLVRSPTSLEGKKAASTLGLSEALENSRTDVKTPSIKSIQSERKSKSKPQRPHSLTSIARPSPVVGTDAVNVAAIRDIADTVEDNDPKYTRDPSRSRSTSSPIERTSDSPPRAKPFLSESAPSGDRSEGGSIRSSIYSETEEHLDEVVSRSNSYQQPSMPSSVPDTFSHSRATMAANGSSSTSLSSRDAATRRLNEKSSLGAIGSATAVAKKWFSKARNMSQEEDGPKPLPLNRHLPPGELPTPITKRTEPINVPKRRSLPPPLLPVRNSRQGAAPALPPRDAGIAFTGSCDDMLVVPAPVSEPTTPSPIDEGGNEFLGNGVNGTSAERDGPPPLPKRNSSIKTDNSSWERKRMRERALEETEQWHAAEEEQMRTKVPWEPDESLP
ncbi:hypothetical protein RUND412_010259 [Rhizina undulata]